MNTTKRKGARSAKDITPELQEQLNQGTQPTANLVEWLAVDQVVLLKHLLQQLDRPLYYHPILAAIAQLKKQTVNTINEAIGTTLLLQIRAHKDDQFMPALASHTSDLVRCWACYIIGKDPDLDITDKLQQIQPFAADDHFGVREICWMALRPDLTAQLQKSIGILTPWTANTDPNIRRFVSEATRPRGVWCAHIEQLKQEPELALPLLTPLRSDASASVRDSVGNWLNDASKSRPDFVRNLCKRWAQESATPETTYIIRRALRTLDK